MSKRAAKEALEAYPQKWFRDIDGDCYDCNRTEREAYMEGYEQAEKDTIERTESHLESVLPNFLDVDTVKWIIKDLKKAMEEENE